MWIVEQYQPVSINKHLANGRPWDLDRTYGGLQVLPPYTARDREEGGFSQGNADALYRHRKAIAEFGADVLLVLSADHVYTLDYGRVIEAHRESGADVTMVTTRVPRESAGRFGVVRVEPDGRVNDFLYKPDDLPYDTVTTEVFAYSVPMLLDALAELDGDPDDGETPLRDFGHELLPRLVERGKARAFPLEGFWRDVGTLESYWQAHRELLAPDPALGLDDPEWPILSYGVQRLPVRVQASGRVDVSLLSPGCVVRGTVERSVIGPGVTIEKGATVRDAILFEGVVVGRGATVQRAIVDGRVRIGADAVVGESGEGEPGGDDLVLVARGAEIAAGSEVRKGARMKADEGRRS